MLQLSHPIKAGASRSHDTIFSQHHTPNGGVIEEICCSITPSANDLERVVLEPGAETNEGPEE